MTKTFPYASSLASSPSRKSRKFIGKKDALIQGNNETKRNDNKEVHKRKRTTREMSFSTPRPDKERHLLQLVTIINNTNSMLKKHINHSKKEIGNLRIEVKELKLSLNNKDDKSAKSQLRLSQLMKDANQFTENLSNALNFTDTEEMQRNRKISRRTADTEGMHTAKIEGSPF